MSRIDEALRRAARTEELPANGSGDRSVALASGIAPSTLNEYAIEDQADAHETVQNRQKPVAAKPHAHAPARPLAIPAALKNKLVIGPDIPPLTIEQYRRLAGILHDLQEKHGLKTLMVSSALPQEGKTLTVANLALTLSESYHQRVLLVDADLRRPSLHEVFGIPNGTGLSDIVNGTGSSISPAEISPCLSVLTAGRRLSSPLAMLTSERIRDVVVDAAKHFDWVLIDTPPVGLLPDAQLVARLSDAVLFVIAAGSTPFALVQRAVADLGPDRIVGTVLNRVDKRRLASDDSYGGYYLTQFTEAGAR
jgi:capsular exopolysaccharide synthesis family protein